MTARRSHRAVAAVAIALATAGRSAWATPSTPPTLDADLAGDGTLAHVQAGGDGSLFARAASGALLGTVHLRTPPADIAAVTLAAHPFGGGAVVEARVARKDDPAQEEAIAGVRGGAFVLLYDGEVGPVDVDAAASRAVAFAPDAITLYQTAPGVERCDATPVRLFPARLVPGATAPLPVAPPLPDTSSVLHVAAVPAGPLARPLGVFRYQAASTEEGDDGSAAELTPPRALDDLRAGTVWTAAGPQGGIGQFATARASLPGVHVRALLLVPGAAPPSTARVRRLVLTFAGGAPPVVVDVPSGSPAGAPLVATLPAPVATSCVTLTIDGAARARTAPAVLAEADLLTDLDGPGGADRLVALVSRGGKAGDAAAEILRRGGPDAVAALAGALPVARGQERRLLLESLAALHDPGAAPALVAALRAPDLDAADADLIDRALAAEPAAALPPLLALLGDVHASDEARAASARLLGRISSPPALDALVAAAGQGGPSLRHAVRQAIILRAGQSRSAASVLAALSAAGGPASTTTTSPSSAPTSAPALTLADRREADLAATLGPLAQADPPQRAAVVARLAAIAGDARRSFEPRARAATSIGEAVAGAPAGAPEARAAAGALASLRDPARDRDPILRGLAARALGNLSPPLALPPLRAALADPDPGARDAAVAALGGLDDPGAVAAVASIGAHDGWVFVRRDAAGALGRGCSDDRRAALVAIAADPDETVDLSALRGLVHCRDRRAVAPLLALATNPAYATSTRDDAAGLLTLEADPSIVPQLAKALDQVRGESLRGDPETVRIAISLAQALGQTASHDALAPLESALLDPALPQLRAGAALALGRLCRSLSNEDRAMAAAYLHKATADPDTTVQSTARAARAICE